MVQLTKSQLTPKMAPGVTDSQPIFLLIHSSFTKEIFFANYVFVSVMDYMIRASGLYYKNIIIII